MKQILTLAGMMAAVIIASSCSTSHTLVDDQGNPLSKEQLKQYQATLDSLTVAAAHNAVESHDFVVEADKLVFRDGSAAYVTPSTNFISLIGNKAVVQVSPFRSFGGPNGVGGITLNGTTSTIKITHDKRGNTDLSMIVTGPVMSATVTMTLYKGTDRATVRISSNFRNSKVTLEGRVMPSEMSTVVKGNSI